MLFDLWFLGFPLVASLCLMIVAVREGIPKFWHCAFSLLAYCVFYLAGGRDVLLYIVSGMCIAGGWCTLVL